jgi:PIN domain nuclease of toxin-antitoxin system
VIILDTHIWIWWVDNNSRLIERQRSWIQQHQVDGLGVSIISCWEVAKAVESGRLELSKPVSNWLVDALSYPGVRLLELTVPIVVESTQLVGFHRDPGDQVIVATARVHQCSLLSADQKILAYSGVNTLT